MFFATHAPPDKNFVCESHSIVKSPSISSPVTASLISESSDEPVLVVLTLRFPENVPLDEFNAETSALSYLIIESSAPVTTALLARYPIFLITEFVNVALRFPTRLPPERIFA